MSFNTIDDILDFAIDREEAASLLYEKLALKSKSDHLKKLFLDFSLEEKGHHKKLKRLKEEGIPSSFSVQTLDLKIEEGLSSPDTHPKTLQDSLIFAMKREKEAFKLYMALSNNTTTPQLRSFFIDLANEEAKHKLRFELEYDDLILTDN